ncbi:FAD-dependent monooxygenase [Catellatospora sp. NPDC049609]|uniref:FAD-dependent monooxygenase n=1 Tax=Catellatospora sp. NPDC049609 TaxID=3155505 RepID=UPI00341DDF76
MSKGLSKQVIVVGAGPVGLTLACELALSGVRTRVIERRAWRTKESRAMGLYPGSMELFDMRGLGETFAEFGNPADRITLSTGGGIELAALDSRYAYLNVIPQSTIEEILETRARELGVEIVRRTEVVEFTQDETGVTVTLRTDGVQRTERCAYLVGCDGSHSVVREQLGIDFGGSTHQYAAMLADVRLAKPPAEKVRLTPAPGAVAVTIDYGDGWYRLACLDRSQPWSDEPLTMEVLQQTFERILGYDLGLHSPRWLARFKVHERLADRYRVGRVMIAGDAAHLHSPLGGQGMNLGIHDAFNLGWKLAAEIDGWAPPGLLDSYEVERRPVAAATIRLTERGTHMVTSASPPVRGVRQLVTGRVLRSPRVQRAVAARVAGLTTAYVDGPGEGALAGTRMPGLTLHTTGGVDVQVHELLRNGTFLHLELRGAEPADVADWGELVTTVAGRIVASGGWGAATAVLVRPDGHVAWSTTTIDDEDRAAETAAAITTWCGTPYPGRRPVVGWPHDFPAEALAAPADALAAPAVEADLAISATER